MPPIEKQRHFTPQEWSSFADAELPPSQREEMQAHLNKCAECAALARSFRVVQRGAEKLAKQSEPPPAGLRTRLLAVAVALMQRDLNRGLWMRLLGVSLVAILCMLGFWFVSRRQLQSDTPPPAPPALVPPKSGGFERVRLSLDLVLIERYPMAADLVYEVTIHNDSESNVRIARVTAANPLGKFEREFNPPVEIPKGTHLPRHPFRIASVSEETVLLPGLYQIEVVTDKGSLSAERPVRDPQKP